MNFHLNYTPAPSPVKISHTDKILLIGSCFAENIGNRLINSKFDCTVNPNGILFNPESIAKALRSYISKPDIKKDSFVKSNGLFHNLDYHGDFSHPEEAALHDDLIQSQCIAHDRLKEVKFLIITFGSAFAYRHLRTNSIVANCHKLPQQEFKKELLSVETIVSEYKKLIEELKRFNPGLKVIFTVSPVKYLRDGVIENNISKSTLLLAANQLRATNYELPTSYFPAYELVTDDLRDHRFYKEDMAHPNEQAINYVWEKFSECYFSEETKSLNQKIKELTLAVNHRPLHKTSVKHAEFKTATMNKCTQLENAYPFLDFSEEKSILNQTP